MYEEDGTNHMWVALLAIGLLGPAFAGCAAPDGSTGTGAFYVKDAPEDDWSHVNVTFTSVRVHQGGEDGSNESGEWVTVAENETGREVDLLGFSTADARALLGAAELEPGTYNQVLINVTEAYGVHKDSGEREDFTLTRPQLRLTRAWQIEENATTHVIADIDLDRSIVEQGNGEYRFNPVIGQVVVEQNDEEPRSERGRSTQAGDGGGANQPGDSQAPMTTYVKDAPTDEFDEVWLAFDQIEVHYAGNGSDANATDDNSTGDNQTDANETDGQWITTVDEPREVDLLKYNQSESKAFLGEANVPTGRYTQIRVQVTDAWGVDENGTEVNITVASSTARVVRSWTVSENGTTTQATIDLNLDRSLVKTGGQGQGQGGGQADTSENRTSQWRMTPVIGKVLVDHVAVDPKQDRPDTEDVAEDTTQDTTQDQTGAGDQTSTDDTSDASSSDQQGEATTYVKDAPTDEFDEIWLSFDEVRVHYAGNGSDANATDENETDDETDDNGTAANETDDGEWRTLFDGERSVNLLNFSDEGAKAFLGNASLDAGRYTQIRVNVTDAWGVQDGNRTNVTVPSGTAKTARSFEVTANQTTQIVIDVDLDKSMKQTGGPQGEGDWKLTPVIGQVLVDHVDEDPQQDVPDQAQS